MVKSTLSPRAAAISNREILVLERLVRVEEGIKTIGNQLEVHSEQDERYLTGINSKLSTMEDKLDQLILGAAKIDGEKKALESLSKFQGSKWGGIVGGVIAGAIWAINSLLGA